MRAAVRSHAALLFAFTLCGSPALAQTGSNRTGGVTYNNSSTSVRVSNSRVLFRVDKTGGNIYSLTLDGRELADAAGGGGYFDLNDSRWGYFRQGHHDKPATTYSLRSGGDFVDLTITHSATPAMPLTVRQHYILRDDESGIHLFTEFSHSAAMPADRLDQTRFVLRGHPNIFTHHSVEDDPSGDPWRQAAAIMPTPAEIAAARTVQDATYDLLGTGSVYPRRYYTKYDWSVYQKDHLVHGYYGNGYGAWIIQANKDSLNGGPTKQNLTEHADGKVLLNMLQSGHYGSESIHASGDWSKTYGPFFLYLNRGPGGDALRADALTYAAPAYHQAFYDSLDIPGYVTSTDRSTVDGRINLSTGDRMDGTTVVLADNNTEFQRSVGYQYWVNANPDGTFRFTGVRPGTYRLSAYKSGAFGELRLDNVIVEIGTTLTLPDQIWTLPNNGTTLWQIGIPDRTAAEFRHGNEYRNYWGTFDFDQDFPGGIVNFIVGQSDPSLDWNYVHWRTFSGVSEPDWNVQFNLDSAPPVGATATLTVALSGYQTTRDAGLAVWFNTLSRRLDWSLPAADSSSVATRSGISGLYLLREFRFPANWLRAGTNTVTFHLAGSLGNVLYDAIRLEVSN